jgi:hypothetical protein
MTFSFVCGGWILFRATDMSVATTVFTRILGPASGGIHWFFLPFWMLLPIVVAAHVIGERLKHSGGTVAAVHAGRHSYLLRAMPAGAGALAFLVTVWAIVFFLLVPLQRSPFIYFQF